MTDSHWVVASEDLGARLDKFLASSGRLGSRGRASDALDRGRVFVNGVEVSRAEGSRRLEAGDRVRVWHDRPGSARRRGPRSLEHEALDVLYEDEVLVVVNKPPGLLVVPLAGREEAPSVESELVRHFRSRGRRRPFVVHRIDRDTSGLVVFAKSPDAQIRLKDQFRRREPERVYLAAVHGHPRPAEGTWRDRLAWDSRDLVQKPAHPREAQGTEAVSRYRTIESFSGASLLRVTLVTGKRNQIRVQARLHGHMLVGERLYVDTELRSPIRFARQALHACRLAFRHPIDGRLLRFEAPVPPDLEELLKSLRGTRPNRSRSGRV